VCGRNALRCCGQQHGGVSAANPRAAKSASGQTCVLFTTGRATIVVCSSDRVHLPLQPRSRRAATIATR
jgi:hypothetical protein